MLVLYETGVESSEGVPVARCTGRAPHGLHPLTVADTDSRAEVREFLSTRRAKLVPADVGLPDMGTGVKASVLDAIARALRLDEAERAGSKTFHHTAVDDLDLAYESVDMLSERLTLTIYAAEPASRTAEVLSILASWVAPVTAPAR